jgi:hypothetical protein
MKDHTRPTSDWEHSHALETGDILIDTAEDTRLLVEAVGDDGGVTWVAVDDSSGAMGERIKFNDTRETFSEEEITTALADGIVESTTGLSHELATY